MPLEAFADNLWVASQPHSMMGLALSARMTVHRTATGTLWLHSPIRRTAELAEAIEALGPVGWIVAPNTFHHMYVGDWVEAHPEAELWGPQGLVSKRPDLSFQGLFGRDPLPWTLDSQFIGGTLLEETMFLCSRTRTVISADLFLNIHETSSLLTRGLLTLSGAWQQPGVTHLGRMAVRDRARARADFEKVLAWDFDKVIVSHGRCVHADGKAATRAGLRWLLGD